MFRRLALASALWAANCFTPVVGQENGWERHIEYMSHSEFCWPRNLFDDVSESGAGGSAVGGLYADYHGGAGNKGADDGATFLYLHGAILRTVDKAGFFVNSGSRDDKMLSVRLVKAGEPVSGGKRSGAIFLLRIREDQRERWQPLIEAIKRGLPCDSGVS